MRELALLLCLAAGALGCASAGPARSSTSALQVGVGSIDITPEEPIRLTGYGNRTSLTSEVRQRLHAKALAFRDRRGRPSVLITADLIGVPLQVTEEVARRLSNAGIERAQIAIAATHTHTGPMLGGTLPYIFGSPIPREHQAASDRYTRMLVDRLERVARAALADVAPARVGWTIGRATFAANRRVIKDGKWTAFGVNPQGPVDHDLPVLAVHSPEGRLRAVLVNYACHATTLEGKDNFVHGDWPGSAQEILQARHPGATALVAIGTGADANPNPRGGGLPHVERHAREIADSVDRLLKQELRPLDTAPAGRLRTIDLRFASVPTREEWLQHAKKSDAYGMFARDALARLDRGERIPQTTPYPVQTWAFGDDLAMVFLGGEVVAEYGLRLKRELDRSRLWVNAYSNDVAFYVASRRMIPEGGYEVDRSMAYYGQPAPLAEGTEDQIIAAIRALLPSTFAK
ncbi:MAG TPA: neutral/alkaline non-lysosomal ceramidase N-terminal domain-containing protein [Vicinamibacterales bacterium]|nr:neutral/alkaline non-lysosomal ceramidase N-terminal domain-containing protein [Vicinamibacterales bacterium]